jgi:hypothetical protein
MAHQNLSLRQKLLTGVAVAAAATGGTVAALAATGDGKHPGHRAGSSHAGRSHPRCLAGQLRAPAGYLGLSQDQLRSELDKGKSLAQVAEATPGKSVGGLVEAIVSARKARLASALARGRITKAQENASSVKVTRRVSARVSRTDTCRPRATTHHVPDLVRAAHYLGVPSRQLRAELSSGRSLAQVAAATPGKSATGLIAALVTERKARLAAAAAAGKITHAHEQTRAAHLESRLTAAVNRVVRPTTRQPGSLLGRLSVASAYLGMTPEQLKTALRSGSSLAQVANTTKGKSAAGLIAALIADRRAKLAAAVASGRLTAAKEKHLLAALSQRITAAVNGAPR